MSSLLVEILVVEKIEKQNIEKQNVLKVEKNSSEEVKYGNSGVRRFGISERIAWTIKELE